mmetsp:Transcript_32243/g.64302  ORF Transcript_32243/g.64302 Transcript_32243/m.64302 type:complete len:93 (-) Transcript_32243:332-610(-)
MGNDQSMAKNPHDPLGSNLDCDRPGQSPLSPRSELTSFSGLPPSTVAQERRHEALQARSQRRAYMLTRPPSIGQVNPVVLSRPSSPVDHVRP